MYNLALPRTLFGYDCTIARDRPTEERNVVRFDFQQRSRNETTRKDQSRPTSPSSQYVLTKFWAGGVGLFYAYKKGTCLRTEQITMYTRENDLAHPEPSA